MSGPSEDYDDDDEAELANALDDAWNEYDGSEGTEPATGSPTTMHITAEIEWAGEFARTPVRTVRLDGLDLTGVRDALTAARKAGDAAETAGRFRAQGWENQLKALTKDPRGSAATDRAGLTVTRETLVKWLAGNDPNPANQRKISTAYQDMRDQVARDAQTKAGRANHQVAEQVNRMMEREFSSEVRFRRIESLELYD